MCKNWKAVKLDGEKSFRMIPVVQANEDHWGCTCIHDYNYTQEDECDASYYNGYNDGYEDGREEGYDKGYEDGHEQGYEEGHDEISYESFEDGMEKGYNEGYEQGLYDGKNSIECKVVKDFSEVLSPECDVEVTDDHFHTGDGYCHVWNKGLKRIVHYKKISEE